MFSKIFAACFVAVLVSIDVAASIEPGFYRILNVGSQSSVRTYSENSPLFVSSTREFPGPFEVFDIREAENSSGYTIKNVGLNKYVSAAAELPEQPLFAKGTPEPFEIEQAGEGQFVIKAVNKDLVWTIALPVIPRGDVILFPAQGRATQRFTFSRLDGDSDLVHQTDPSSAKFRAKEHAVENCGHKWSFYRPVEAVLQYVGY